MIRKLCFMLLLLCAAQTMYGQTGGISGKVTDADEKKPMPYATVTVRQGEEIINFKLTTADGAFKVPLLPLHKKLQAAITYVGYQTVIKDIELQDDKILDLGEISMKAGKELKEVSITAQRAPIVVKKDTVEFTADAFKTMPNALVEDLFKKLPGFRIDKDGKLTVNGKPVQRLLVNSREFFGADPGMAMKNLDAATIDKVQVTENVDELKYGIQDLADKGQAVTINLTMKKWAKQGVVGKAGIGAGTHKTYEANVIGNIFRDTLQVSLLAFSNNTNRNAFSAGDVMSLGGFSRARSRSVRISGTGLQVNGISFGGLGDGVNTESGAGLNGSTVTKGGTELGGQYFYGRKNNDTRFTVNRVQNLDAGYLNNDMQVDKTSVANTHAAAANLYYKLGKNKTSSIAVNPAVTSGEITGVEASRVHIDNDGATVKGLSSNINNNTNETGFRNGTTYTYKAAGKKVSFTASNDIELNTSKLAAQGAYNDTTYTNGAVAAAYKRGVQEKTQTNNIESRLKMAYTVKKAEYSITALHSYAGGDYTLQNTYAGMQGADMSQYDADMHRVINTIGLTPQATFTLSKAATLTMAAGGSYMNSNTSYLKAEDVKFKGWYFTPNISLRIGNDLYVRFSRQVTAPTMQQVREGQNMFDPLQTVTGNDSLRPTITTSPSINYYKYFTDMKLNVSIWGEYKHNKDVVISAVNTYPDGSRIIRPVNTDHSDVFRSNGNISKDFKLSKDWNVILSPGYWLSIDKKQAVMNNKQTGVTQGQRNWWATINFQYADVMEWSVGYDRSYSKTRYDSYFTDLYTTQEDYNTALNLNFNKKVLINSSLTVSNTRQNLGAARQMQYFLNAQASYVFLKGGKGMLTLRATDLLNQAKSVRTTVSESYAEVQRVNVLPRYVFLGFTYNLKGYNGPRKSTAKWNLF